MKTKSLDLLKMQFLSIIFLSMTLGFNSAYSQEDESEGKTLSPYFVVISEHPSTDFLPLKETSAKVNIVGVIADVTIKQIYINTGKNTLEAIYTFPLSTKAAVYAMQMKIGNRVITAKIEEKEKARKDYEIAKSEGKRTSLLEQSRPNVFTMNVANIAVNDTITVELKYTELLIPENGIYSFIYPTVVGPRYSNKNAENAKSDDNFVNTPYTKKGVMPYYDFNFKLEINAGIPIQSVECPSHKTLLNQSNLFQSNLSLDPSEVNCGNRDLIVNYSLQGNKIESGIMLYENGDENFFLMMVQPPKKIMKEDIPPREYIFIVDVSGSMEGFPLTISKKLLRNLILNLNPTDKFNVLLFAGNTGILSANSLDANQENINKAINFINNQNGGGGTELLPALKHAFSIPRYDEDVSRSFVIVTDGYVDVEKEAFEMIRKNSGDVNFFCFGIGSSVNRYLLEGMAFMGNGEPMIVTKPNEADAQAEKFRTYINTPVLTKIRTDFGSLQVYDLEPVASPDMLAERPIIIFGKYKGKANGKIALKGKIGRKGYTQTFDLTSVKPNSDFSAIRYLWARDRIKLLDYYCSNNSYNNNDNNDKIVKEITNLGLKYNLMTNYTSFIAIDEEFKVDSLGKLVKVKQAIPLPENVSDYAVGHEVVMVAGVSVQSSSISKMKVNRSKSNSNRANSSKVQVIEESEEIVAVPEIVTKPTTDTIEIYTVVEQSAEFPGGEAALKIFIEKNLNYPSDARSKGIQGIVYLSFVVEKDGSITNIKVLRGIGGGCDEEAIRMLKAMPKWIPAKQNQKIVRSHFTIPIRFVL